MKLSVWSIIEHVNFHPPAKLVSKFQSYLRYDITNVPIFFLHGIMAILPFCNIFYVIYLGFSGSWPQEQKSKFSTRINLNPTRPSLVQNIISMLKRPLERGGDHKSYHKILIILQRILQNHHIRKIRDSTQRWSSVFRRTVTIALLYHYQKQCHLRISLYLYHSIYLYIYH